MVPIEYIYQSNFFSANIPGGATILALVVTKITAIDIEMDNSVPIEVY